MYKIDGNKNENIFVIQVSLLFYTMVVIAFENYRVLINSQVSQKDLSQFGS